ncbi:MAG: A/G-specific adenine glycosylase [Fimbriimonadaceae bacterium]
MADGLRRRLLRWYDANKRDLPWRRDTDTYRVWVSETMLQQTTVAAVVPRYEGWMQRFPTVESLARAREVQVLAMWQGLGYYRRAQNLHRAAKTVAKEGWPKTLEDWKRLPGVGEYTAGAVCSICFGARVPSVDANVARVFARHTGDASINPKAKEWATALADCPRPGDVNQALMELGATVCRPKRPLCSACPMRSECVALANKNQESLPTPAKPTRTKQIKQTIYVPESGGKIGVRKVADGDWWQGMWEFVRSDSTNGLPKAVTKRRRESLGTLRYAVTNHRIEAKVVLVQCDGDTAGLTWKSPRQLESLPLPSPQRRALKLALKHLQAIGKNSVGTAKDPSSAKK